MGLPPARHSNTGSATAGPGLGGERSQVPDLVPDERHGEIEQIGERHVPHFPGGDRTPLAHDLQVQTVGVDVEPPRPGTLWAM